MTKFAKTILSVVILVIFIIIAFYSYSKSKKVNEPAPAQPLVNETLSIKGCYVARLSKDVYTLKIDSQDGSAFEGRLDYNNYEKDSSSGSFEGTFNYDILLGIYSFDSEGMRSNSQLIFKKEGDSFIQGFGDSKTEGDNQVLVDTSNITYDPKSTFKKSDDCTG